MKDIGKFHEDNARRVIQMFSAGVISKQDARSALGFDTLRERVAKFRREGARMNGTRLDYSDDGGAPQRESTLRERTAQYRHESFPPDHVESLWDKVPGHLRDGMLAYIMDHLRAGDFLMAVFSNDLQGALMRADPVALSALKDIVRYVQSCAPAPCWGSKAATEDWLSEETRRHAQELREIRYSHHATSTDNP